ncbi:MAG: DUF4252 domain-containing protein [Mangrovibacterium sp.]
MKIRLLWAIPVLLLLFSCTRKTTIDAAFSKYNHQDGIVSMTIPGFLIRTATWGQSLEPEEERLLRQVDQVKILSVEDRKNYRDLNFYNELKPLIDQENYTELMAVKSAGDDIRILANMKKKDRINELLILTNGNDKALIYVKGNFSAADLAQLAGKGYLRESGALQSILNRN